MTCKSEITEEAIIGLVRGEVQHDHEHSLRNHIEDCCNCKSSYYTWSEIFQNITDDRLPSSHTKKKIIKTIKKQQRHFQFNITTFIFITTCFAAVMLLIGYTMNPANSEQPILGNSSFVPKQPIDQPFLVNDDTDVYEINPEWNDSVKGYAWINPYSHEMMLLVDGLHPISLNDYQAWIETEDELKNAGLFKVNGQKGQLYIRDGIINQLEHIMVSKEPIGGSEIPTDPNPFLIKLNSK